jgi:hypothetical protein
LKPEHVVVGPARNHAANAKDDRRSGNYAAGARASAARFAEDGHPPSYEA